MELFAFYAGCVAVYLYARLTTPAQRLAWLRSFWTLVLLLGAAGLAWESLH